MFCAKISGTEIKLVIEFALFFFVYSAKRLNFANYRFLSVEL